jgi:hypothetical protein
VSEPLSLAPDHHHQAARWRESFLLSWRELPQRVQLPAPGKRAHRESLLEAGMRLVAVARPGGLLNGPQGDPLTEQQLLAVLGVSRNKGRGLLRWLAANGWLEATPTQSRRDANERALTIPASAWTAPPGWPLVKGSTPRSTGDPREASIVGLPRRSTGDLRAVPSAAVVEGPPEQVVGSPSAVVGSPGRSAGDPPPGYPVTRKKVDVKASSLEVIQGGPGSQDMPTNAFGDQSQLRSAPAAPFLKSASSDTSTPPPPPPSTTAVDRPEEKPVIEPTPLTQAQVAAAKARRQAASEAFELTIAARDREEAEARKARKAANLAAAARVQETGR